MQPTAPEVTALAINVAVPADLQWTDVRRDEEFLLTTLNVRLLPDGSVAAKAYGRPTAGGRGAYTSFRVPDRAELRELIAQAADRAAELWAANTGMG
jgi:hypothetical protein